MTNPVDTNSTPSYPFPFNPFAGPYGFNYPWTQTPPFAPSTKAQSLVESISKTKPGPKAGTKCSLDYCSSTFWESNLYLVQVQIGSVKFAYCDVNHFLEKGASPLSLLIETELQEKSKEEAKNLPKSKTCSHDRCSNMCNTTVALQFSAKNFYFCKSVHLHNHLALLSSQQIQKNGEAK